MSDTVVLNITDRSNVELDGVMLETTDDVTQALQQILCDRPAVIVAIEADGAAHYEAVGRAIYGSTRAGFCAERLRVTVDGQPLAPPPSSAT